MANVLGVYSPIFYAQEALKHLYKSLGMARRVHRGFDLERRAFRKGKVISIRKPASFTALAAPASTLQDLDTGTTNIELDQHFEVRFALDDKEQAYTGTSIIDEHIKEAAYAIGDKIDQSLCALYKDVPWFKDSAGSTLAVGDLTSLRQVMFDNGVDLTNESMIHLQVDGKAEKELLDISAFTQHQGAGNVGVESQLRGHIGTRYGMEVFANQNAPSHTPGTASTGTLAVNGTFAKGDTTINLDAGAVTGTLVPGDTFVIAGNSQRYAVQNTVTASGNAFTGVQITPPLAAAPDNDAVVTVELESTKTRRLMGFHRDAFAIAFARLPDMRELDGDRQLGANIAAVQDKVSGIAVRARKYYDGDNSRVIVGLDALWGVQTLDPNKAANIQHNP